MFTVKGLVNAVRDLLDVLGRQQGVGEHEVGAGLGVEIEPPDRFIDAVDGDGVGSRLDGEMGIGAGVGRRLDLLDHLIGADDLLAGHMPAAFRPHLVLDHDAGEAGILEGADRRHRHLRRR